MDCSGKSYLLIDFEDVFSLKEYLIFSGDYLFSKMV